MWKREAIDCRNPQPINERRQFEQIAVDGIVSSGGASRGERSRRCGWGFLRSTRKRDLGVRMATGRGEGAAPVPAPISVF